MQLEPGVGRLMRSLFERRSRADYGLGETPVDEATQAIADANSVVAALGRRLKTPVTPDDEGTDSPAARPSRPVQGASSGFDRSVVHIDPDNPGDAAEVGICC